MDYRICAIIPTHNHHLALDTIIKRLELSDVNICIINDGSNVETSKALIKCAQNNPVLHLINQPINMGKGAAVTEGLKWAKENGYTHAFQIDADGQHSLENLDNFINLSRNNPQALLSGHPIYDQSIPLSRKIGRWVTHVWVWIETLSFRITDSMCGFRIYPIDPTLSVLDQNSIGPRMDFDTELMVRMFWQGTPVLMSSVKVIYPEGNLSNFDPFYDNWRITKMHTRLFFSMIKNLSKLLFHRPKYNNVKLPEDASLHWSSMEERGAFVGLYFLALCYRILGRRLCKIIGTPVVLYFYLTGAEQRKASNKFLTHVFKYRKEKKRPGLRDSLSHFFNFFDMALDKFAAWTGLMDIDEVDASSVLGIRNVMNENRGGMFLVSHLGNMEFCRAIACREDKKRLHVLMHTKNSKRFNQIIKAFTPQSRLNLIEVTELGPDTIIYLKDCVESGDWVVIAADRIPVVGNKRISYASFLGQPAPFSQGPYILASLLECQVYTATAIRHKSGFEIITEPFERKILLNRKTREEDLARYASKYSKFLEEKCMEYPYQWFNFFDFWERKN